MNRQEIITNISQKAHLTKRDSEIFLEAFMDLVTETLAKGGNIHLLGFGTFELVDRSARLGKNLRTGEVMHIPACKVPRFRVGKLLKDAVKLGIQSEGKTDDEDEI